MHTNSLELRAYALWSNQKTARDCARGGLFLEAETALSVIAIVGRTTENPILKKCATHTYASVRHDVQGDYRPTGDPFTEEWYL